MKRQIIISLLVVVLASCTPALTPAPTATSPLRAKSTQQQTGAITKAAGTPITFHLRATSGSGVISIHALDFIDAKANSLRTIAFGTDQENALQSDGWSAKKTDPTEGSFQQIGIQGDTAVLTTAVPPGTEGVLLRMTTAGGEAWLDISLGDDALGSLRVTKVWRTGYLPIGDVQPAVPSGQLPRWQEGRYFPIFPQTTGRIYAIRVQSEMEEDWIRLTTPEWRINQSFDLMNALTLVAMQGVINRTDPGVYLVWEQPDVTHDSPSYYLENLKAQTEVVVLDLDTLSAIQFLYRRYQPFFHGAVVYDPAVPDTINLATMYAGLEDRLILAPEQLALPGIPNTESVLDLRPLAQENHWEASEAGATRLYQWVYDNLWTRLEHRVIGVFSPGPPTSTQVPGAGNYLPFNIGSRDYAVALNLPSLWLSPVEGSQKRLFERFLADASSPIPVYGFFGNEEVETVRLVSRQGDFCPVITNGNAPFASANLSLHAALPIQPAVYQAELNPKRILATLNASHVVSFLTSDGDSIQYLMDRGFLLNWENVQGHRFGWSNNPVLADLAPLVWNDYVQNRSEVSLLMGPSGAGYANVGVMDDAGLQGYLQMTGCYMDRSGMRTLLVDFRDLTWDQYYARRYYDALHDHGLLGMVVGGGNFRTFGGLRFRYAGAPTPGTYFTYEPVSSKETWIIDDLLASKAGAFTMDATKGWFQGTIVEDPAAEGGTALLFTLDQPLGWIQGPFVELPPGTYTVTYRLKMADTRSNLPVASIYVAETENRSVPPIVERTLTPRDFTPGKYQDFTLTFTIDRWASRIELGVTPFNGANWPDNQYAAAELWADWVHLERKGGLDFPVFSMVAFIMTRVQDPKMPELVDAFEAAGILVLTPDEYMASLNPEYMISFAYQYLGAQDPSLAQAKALLENGQFFESLLTVRQALSRNGNP